MFIKRRGQEIHFTSLKDLVGLHIGVGRGYAYTSEFDSADYLTKKPVVKLSQNLEKLALKRIDLVLSDQLIAMYYMNLRLENPELNSDFEFIAPAMSQTPLYFGISKKNPRHKEIIQQFNQFLSEIKSDGTYEGIFNRHGYAFDTNKSRVILPNLKKEFRY